MRWFPLADEQVTILLNDCTYASLRKTSQILQTFGLGAGRLDQLFQQLDLDGNGEVDFEVFERDNARVHTKIVMFSVAFHHMTTYGHRSLQHF